MLPLTVPTVCRTQRLPAAHQNGVRPQCLQARLSTCGLRRAKPLESKSRVAERRLNGQQERPTLRRLAATSSADRLALERCRDKRKQLLGRRIVRQAEFRIEPGVVGFLGAKDLHRNARVLQHSAEAL